MKDIFLNLNPDNLVNLLSCTRSLAGSSTFPDMRNDAQISYHLAGVLLVSCFLKKTVVLTGFF